MWIDANDILLKIYQYIILFMLGLYHTYNYSRKKLLILVLFHINYIP